MSENPTISNLNSLNTNVDKILELLNSKRAGYSAASYARELPVLDLAPSDVENIFQELYKMGIPVQEIIKNSRKKYPSPQIKEFTQTLVDHHATALHTIQSIQSSQMDPSDNGLMIEVMIGFRNAIINLRNDVTTYSSYITSKDSSPKDSSLSRILNNTKIILAIITVILSVGGYSLYSYTVNIEIDNSISDNSVDNSIEDSSTINNSIDQSTGKTIITNSSVTIVTSP